MSRCFPYIPLANQGTGEPLTAGSIKLQKDSEHSKERKQKKERKHKKHKDEKKKLTAVASSQKDHSSLENGEQVLKKRKYVSSSVLCGKNSNPNEAGKCLVEQLEGSGLSEEHGLPCFIPEPSESSESTQNSSKGRKLEGAGPASKTHGSAILRLKLPKHKESEQVSSSALPGINFPLRKHKDPEPAPPTALPDIILMPLKNENQEQVTSRALPGPKCKDKRPIPSNEEVCRENRVPECAPSNEEMQPCISGRTNKASHEEEASEAGHRHSSSQGRKRSRRSEETEKQLKDLLSGLDPLSSLLQGQEASDDVDHRWLFESSRQPHKDPGAKSCGMDSVLAGCLDYKSVASSFQPVACFMPEFDSYQLPYVLPY